MRVMLWVGALAVLATHSVLLADDVKLLRIQSMPDWKFVHRELPGYPADAADHHIQGVVKISLLIGTDGRVENARVVSGHPLLTPAAMQAVRRWTFVPSEVDGHPVRVQTQVEVPFTLDPVRDGKMPRRSAPLQ